MTYTAPHASPDVFRATEAPSLPDAPSEIADCILTHGVGSSALIIAFSALDDYRGFNDKFDFFRFTDQDEFDVVLVRDLANSWYQMPVPDVPHSGAMLEMYLAAIARRYRRVICLGSSMGGFAAILFGRLIGAHQIIAFGPQTCLIPYGPAGLDDGRFGDRFERIGSLDRPWRYDDLSAVPYAAHVHTSIYCPRDDGLDIAHASRIALQPRVSVIAVAECGHGLINPVKKSGALAAMIRHAMREDAPYDPRPELKRYTSRFAHSLGVAEPLEVDCALNAISLQVTLRNISGAAWTKQTHAGTAIRLQLFRRGEAAIHEQFVQFLADRFDHQQQFREVVEFRMPDLAPGGYALVVDLVFEKMSGGDIGIAPIALNFDIAPAVQLKSLGAFGTPELPVAKRAENGYGRAVWTVQPVGDLHFPANSGRLFSDIGRLAHGVIALPGHVAGFGIYGPWVALPPGCYEAEFDVDPEHIAGEVHIDVVEIPRPSLARRELTFSPAKSGQRLAVAWELASPAEKLEVRLFCLHGFRASVRGLTIRRVTPGTRLMSRARSLLGGGA
jgi:hypothetical protein